jgi:alginate O-acetyltransferase complex protein AlgJ
MSDSPTSGDEALARRRTRERLVRRPAPQNDPLRPARLSRWETRVAALVAFLFFFGPALGWVAGFRPVAFENHALAPFPGPDAGLGSFNQFDAWATDHLVARRRAVELERQVELSLFNEEPPPSWTSWTGPGIPGTQGGATGELAQLRGVPDWAVLQGEQGVLYYWADFRNACLGVDPTTRGLLPVISDLETATTASGRRFLFTVAPDKSTVEQRFLPDVFLGHDCSAARKATTWSMLARHAPRSYVPIEGKLAAAERTSSDLAYIRGDTHWNGVGAMIFAESLAEAVTPGSTAQTTLVRDANHPFPTDLSRLRGGPSRQPGLDVTARRPGVVSRMVEDRWVTVDPHVKGVAAYPMEIWHSQATSSGAPLVQPRVVLFGDSFSADSRAQLAPFFRDLTFVHVDSLYLDPQVAISAVQGADVVLVERAEREMYDPGLLEGPGLAMQIAELPGPR